jgi:hypothetical protein
VALSVFAQQQVSKDREADQAETRDKRPVDMPLNEHLGPPLHGGSGL